jgi:ATP-dependent RNA helicase RhlE
LTQFSDLGLSPNLLKTIEQQGFTTPTPIQMQAIPHILEARDVMGLAQTGTGKTAAFGLPMVHHLTKIHGKPAPKTVRGLVLAPTRELVNQIAENLRAYVKNSHLRVNVVVGGASIGKQIGVLSKGTDILVATPGRLLDLVDRRAVQLNTATFLVLDEADQMLDLGFIHALRKIAKLLGEPRQTLLFSATMPKNMAELAQSYLKDPIRVEVARPGLAADKVRQSVHFVGQKEKSTLLKKLLAESPDGLSLVFSRTKHGAEKLKKHLVEQGFAADSIHGNKSQGQRERAIRGFKSGTTKVLVATDVAARGIDIPGVSHVYNFDLPDVAENYVHRIGRTARAGRGGEAIAFCNPSEQGLLRAVEKLMKISIRVDSGQPAAVEPSAKPQNRRGGGGKKPGGQQQQRRSNGPKQGQRRRRPRAA